MTTLIQATDLHLVAAGRLPTGIDPAAALSAALAAVEASGVEPAALLLTGDLTDAGEPQAYRRLRELGVASRLGAPVLYAAGNHDDRAALREHLLDLPPSRDPYDHRTWLGGLRVIVLDSTVPGSAHGALADEQLDRLADELATPAPEGTVLAMHHPPLPSPSRLATAIELAARDRLAAVVAGSDVRVVLAGHTHVPSAGALAGVPVWVGGSTASTWYGLARRGEASVAAPSVSRVDLFPGGGVLTSTVPIGEPDLGSLDPRRVDELVAEAAARAAGQARP